MLSGSALSMELTDLLMFKKNVKMESVCSADTSALSPHTAVG